MQIAVTFDNGNVGQHFGHAEAFMFYEIKDGEVVNAKLVAPNGAGHEAVADFLAQQGIDLVICGGIGEGAVNALSEAGIVVVPGVEGNVDEAVAKFLFGELTGGGATCDHHDHEEGGCGGSCGSCGGCGGGAPARPLIEGKNAGKSVRVHYRGTLDDGTQFDSSYDRGETLDFVCGVGMMIYGFDVAVANMEEGEEVDVHLAPEEAYGPSDPNAILKIEIAKLPGSEDIGVGERVYLQNSMGQPVPVTVIDKDDIFITLDANHEMAGKALNFHIELVEVVD